MVWEECPEAVDMDRAVVDFEGAVAASAAAAPQEGGNDGYQTHHSAFVFYGLADAPRL